jgi:hypothetical protein
MDRDDLLLNRVKIWVPSLDALTQTMVGVL